MISAQDLTKLARARLKDATALLTRRRHDGAAYICGYAIELGLKARICRHLRWSGFPETRKEFEPYQSFRTHDLDVLLRLSGQEERIRATHFAQWSSVSGWDPEMRYVLSPATTKDDAESMITAARVLIGTLCR
jgi:HEPN domain-containing protein